MGLFKKKPAIQVIKIRHEKRDVENSVTNTFGYDTSRKTVSNKQKVDMTIVLLAVDGELTYKEFNGKWDLDDIKKWEDL